MARDKLTFSFKFSAPVRFVNHRETHLRSNAMHNAGRFLVTVTVFAEARLAAVMRRRSVFLNFV